MKRLRFTAATLSLIMACSMAACAKETPAETEAEPSSEDLVEITVQSDSEETESSETEAEVTEEEKQNEPKSFEGMTAEEICATLTLEQKAAQMMMPAFYNLKNDEMVDSDFGSILSKFDDVPEPDCEGWNKLIDGYQDQALVSDAGIPYFYGQDSVHGVCFASTTVIYPHNINIGAAYDIELTEKMGEYVGSDIMRSKMICNFAPCVAAAQDPRWGRTYESFSSNLQIVKDLGLAYTRGQLKEGVLVCPKHFFADGYTAYGTGEQPGQGMLLDRGNAILTDEEIDAQLKVYQALVDEGVPVIMISHSAVNGVKMHENAEYIQKLRNEMGFEGIVLSDWESIANCSGANLKENLILGVNAGIDMFMQADTFRECTQYIVEAVNEGSIDEARVDDAVIRILKVKIDCGIMTDPYLENIEPSYEWNSEESKECARTLAAESFVPLKTDAGLTIAKGSKIFVAGPAADDMGVLFGGWTYIWQGVADADIGFSVYPQANTILEALEKVAEENEYTIVTDEAEIDSCDVVLLCVGEQPYAEWYGDADNLSITGHNGLDGNEEAITLAKESGLPTYTLIVAGRNVIIEDYISDWDTVLMCYLPGSEGGNAVADVLTGKAEAGGHLAMPYYKSESAIDEGKEWLPLGFSATGSVDYSSLEKEVVTTEEN